LGYDAYVQRMTTGAVSRIARLPSQTGGTVEVAIRNSTIDDLRWWNTNMQPAIDRDGVAAMRGDVGWNWVISVGGFLDGNATLGRQRMLALTMGVQTPDGFIPIGLLCVILHAGYLPAPTRRSVYVLYLADAHREELAKWLEPKAIPKPIARALLDVALCESITRSWEGRLGLYASEAGQDKLPHHNSNRHMTPLSQSQRLPKRLVEIGETPNDGRFFYYTTPKALIASMELDEMR
jgi:hypothetical protein